MLVHSRPILAKETLELFDKLKAAELLFAYPFWFGLNLLFLLLLDLVLESPNSLPLVGARQHSH